MIEQIILIFKWLFSSYDRENNTDIPTVATEQVILIFKWLFSSCDRENNADTTVVVTEIRNRMGLKLEW